MNDQAPKIGRPLTVLTAEQASALFAEYQAKPFNICARARQLGIKRETLSYHVNGGACAAILRRHWRAAIKSGLAAFRCGDKAKAAEWFREAANRIEKTITTP